MSNGKVNVKDILESLGLDSAEETNTEITPIAENDKSNEKNDEGTPIQEGNDNSEELTDTDLASTMFENAINGALSAGLGAVHTVNHLRYLQAKAAE